jgi:hypothetical protein
MALNYRPLVVVTICVSLLSSCTGAGSVTPATLPASAADGIIDDFEDANTLWKPGVWPAFNDSSATHVAGSARHVTHGNHALQLDFDKREQPKAIFILDRVLNLSSGQSIAFDLFNEDGAAGSIGIALRTGTLWQESRPNTLKPGNNAVNIDLTGATFKTGESGWQYSATLKAMNAIGQLAIIVYPNKIGSVFVDKLLLMRKTPLTQAEGLSINATDASHIAIRPAVQTLYQYSKQEFDIDTNVTVENPFDPDQLDIAVHLNSPSGEMYSIPVFVYQDYDADTQTPVGVQRWKARFTPTQEGNWTATAVLSDGKSIFTAGLVSFTVLPAISRGFVRTSQSNPQYLAFDNGEAYFPIGINLGWGHAEPLKDFARWFDALKQNGSNVARIWMASWSFGIEWKDLGLGRYRLDRAWLLDQVMQMAEERGIYVILVMINHGAFNIRVNPEWVDNPYNVEQGGPCKVPEDFATDPIARKLFRQRLRYIAARWAYSPNLLAWEWWNEVNFTPLADPNLLRPWLKEMTAYLRTVDPYHHLTSISYSDGNDPRITSLPELDIMQRHLYSPLDPRTTMAKAYAELSSNGAQKPTKPTLFTEFGFSGASEQPTRFDTEGIQFHNGLWASTFNGFASAAMYWWWDSYIEPNNYWYHLKGLGDFLADQDMSTLSPMPAQVMTATVQASALGRDDGALVWLRSSSYSVDVAESKFQMATLFGNIKEADWRFELLPHKDISVTLSGLHGGPYQVSWYDTRTADLVMSITLAAKNGSLVLTAPTFERDIAAKVFRRSP